MSAWTRKCERPWRCELDHCECDRHTVDGVCAGGSACELARWRRMTPAERVRELERLELEDMARRAERDAGWDPNP
jgi:hypothetical protein